MPVLSQQASQTDRTFYWRVNRSNYRSRGKTLEKARQELSKGFSMGFFPEGGIKSKDFPNMVPFKDGAFILSIESQVPIVPVTMTTNYKILSDDAIFDIRRNKCQLIYHQPIFPKGQTESDMKELKEQVFRVIQDELSKNARG